MFNISRRNFLATSAAASVAASLTGCCSPRFGGEGKIKLAVYGVMGKGFSDWFPMVKSGLAEIVALCDADGNKVKDAQNQLNKKKFNLDLSKVPFYTDYRKMLCDIKCGKIQVEAMTISTSDHQHAACAIPAMKMGIHVYVQKPLVRTLKELYCFNKTAKSTGVVTQMGNQGSAINKFRRAVEILQSGILGDVTEVHVWTNRPVWPQGKAAGEATKGAADPIPATFNWDAWLGTAKNRPFKGEYKKDANVYNPWKICNNVYHPFNWRGFLDFGAGAFGDMACHTMNLPFRGLELTPACAAECVKIEDKDDIAFPMKSIVELTYPERVGAISGRKMPQVKLFWYDGNLKPEAKLMPQVIAKDGKVPNTGCIILGSKGMLCSTNDYGGDSFIALKGEKMVQNIDVHPACKNVARSIPYAGAGAVDGAMDKSDGAAAVKADPHYEEFLYAILEKGPVYKQVNSRCYSDVDFSVPIMESILIGCVAQQVPGKKLKWDHCSQLFDNCEANKLYAPHVREGFEY